MQRLISIVLWAFFLYVIPSIKYLSYRKLVPCFYGVIETRVEVWENEKCCGNASCKRVFPQLFQVLPNFHDCFYNSVETRSTYFLFLLWETGKQLVKAILHEAFFLATCNATMTNKKKNLSSCRGGVTRLQLFSHLATTGSTQSCWVGRE